HALRSLRQTGKVKIGGDADQMDWAMVRKRPGSMRREMTQQGLTMIAAYDGKDGWSVQPFGGRRDAVRQPADDARQSAQSAELEDALVDWKQKGHTVEYLGTEDIEGSDAFKLRVRRQDGDVQIYYLDPDSYLTLKVTTVRMVRGAERRFEVS